jgi:aminoglycoside/choline kinase family phosphotransferase
MGSDSGGRPGRSTTISYYKETICHRRSSPPDTALNTTAAPISPTPADARLALLGSWLSGLPDGLGLSIDSLRPASDDASFRRYFRVDTGPDTRLDTHPGAAADQPASLIVMDAPPPQENCAPFLHAATVFARSGVSVPRVVAADAPRGLMLLEDFGSTTYLSALSAATAQGLYGDAIDALIRLQLASDPASFPPYDRAQLLRELQLFPEWYVARHKEVRLDAAEQAVLDAAFEAILQNNLAQPQVHVHRDFHSRNLMVLEGARNPGILDFQDAVYGPITYDLVSLLRDAYIRWEEAQIIDWAVRYWERARKAGLPVRADFGDFYRDFEWMGLQRHLKVLGIFARLSHRDGKDRYLADLPLVLRYVQEVAARYVTLAPLSRLIDRIEGRSQRVGHTF